MTSVQEVPMETYRFSQFGEPYLYSINRDSFEKQTTQSAYATIFGEKLWQTETCYIFLGTDGGLLVDYILEHGLPYGSRYIFIDLPDVLDVIDAQLSFTKWDEKVALCTFEQWQDQAEEFKIQSYLFTEKVKYMKSIAAIDSYHPSYDDIDDQLSLTLESIKHKTMVSLSRKPFIERQLENLSENIFPFALLANIFSGKTCIVLGGGPSLDLHLDWIKDNRDKVVIIAVSRIAKKLLNENIIPHMVFSVDPHDVSFDVSKEMLELPSSVIFIHSNYVVPKLASQWHGKQFYFGQRAPWNSKLNVPNFELQGPTVTNAAISAAINMGFSQVLLSGVDLCFARNGSTHALGSNEAKVGPQLDFKGQWVDTYDGGKAETMTSFLHATYVLADQGKFAQEKNCLLVNLSPSAAKIEHIAHKLPDEIVIEENNKIEGIIQSIEIEPALIQKTNKQLINDIDKLIKAINDVGKIAANALKDNAALYKDYKNEERNYHYKLKLDKAEKKLTTKFEQTTLFLKRTGIKDFIKIVRADTDEEWSDEQMEETGRLYYQAFLDTINDIKPKINAAKKRIQSRLEEDKASPNFNVLLAQWQQDESFGRAKKWQSIRDSKEVSPSLCTDIDAMCQQYQQVIDNEETAHLKRSKASASRKKLNRKIVHLFQKKNIDGLEQLTVNLDKVKHEDDFTLSIYNLSLAYLAVLKQQPTSALEYFDKVASELLTEDEAIQISALAIEANDIEKATYFLEKLANISDKHKPRYAMILKLNQQFNESIEVYSQYLESNPTDTHIMNALGKLLLELNEIADAQSIFNQVLTIAPNDQEALHWLQTISVDT